MSFKVGDIVQLKSGGPKMTVVQINSSTIISCSWFAGAKHERGAFHPDALQVPAEDKK
ncbi:MULTISPECIES: YodC family protein [unclassified Shinella]|jgi:uncharacterized protein YodC (DUF2158 family)|uniref:YodC family protein n=1 Tax=unclassified Shinella TaxID=2643062 RepID=UPI00234E6AAD|nr:MULTISPECIES: DUF2158 domain-containing protein [unclassified Shinella]MCO5152566.1 DUF2158 domain-containing protein [Shinella sp.]MDC7261861.1 DUF2158 domain-containing protein [Shinella sp. HY16]MDC7268756.1 DUF2158 domain-containing protein [Shinella sp. YZ44]